MSKLIRWPWTNPSAEKRPYHIADIRSVDPISTGRVSMAGWTPRLSPRRASWLTCAEISAIGVYSAVETDLGRFSTNMNRNARKYSPGDVNLLYLA